MGKTNTLKQLILTQLSTIANSGGVYHQIAPANAALPYKTYSLRRVDISDLSRDIYELTIDLWGQSTSGLDDIGDNIEALFNDSNLPQATILPTFYRLGRYWVEDQDKTLKHLQLTFEVSMYVVQ